MRRKGTGTYTGYNGKPGGTWRLKELRINGVLVKKDVCASERQLSAILGVDVPLGRQSEKYWRQYLQSVREAYTRQLTAQSPVPQRIASLGRVIDQFAIEGRDTSELSQELQEAQSISPLDAHQHDSPIIHPDMRETAATIATFRPLEDIDTYILNSLAPKPIPKAESLRHEMQSYLKDNPHARNFLDFFYEVTGNIRLREITAEHYRIFIEKIKAHPTFEPRTKYNYKAGVNAFLKSLEEDHGELNYRFRNNKRYFIPKPDGDKVQWQLSEVKRALEHATGIVRTAILLSLNCGFYRGDMTELTECHFDGTHINKSRAKNKRHGKPSTFVGSWLLWDETKEVLQFGMKEKSFAEGFQKFRDKLDLRGDDGKPAELQALRKTVTQWIDDADTRATGLTNEHGRLYRCEKMHGTHGRFYNKFTDDQRAKVDDALRYIHAKIFG
jgi:hypothetical protein